MSPPRPDVDVEFSIEDGIVTAWDEPRMTALVETIVARELPGDAHYTVELHLVSDATIRALNAEHRGIDRATDVLSFPLRDAQAFVLPEGEVRNLGDVVVSYQRAVEQADEFGHSEAREIAYLVAHGVLHILGYDHEQPEEQRAMREREEEALQPLGYTRTA